MSDSDERVVTGAMLGLFLAFGADVIFIVAALWYVGEVSGGVALRVTGGILGAFSLWVVARWIRLRRLDDDDGTEPAAGNDEVDPLDRLKRRYADGEVSDEEFERRIDRLLDADRRLDADKEATGTAIRERELE